MNIPKNQPVKEYAFRGQAHSDALIAVVAEMAAALDWGKEDGFAFCQKTVLADLNFFYSTDPAPKGSENWNTQKHIQAIFAPSKLDDAWKRRVKRYVQKAKYDERMFEALKKAMAAGEITPEMLLK
jgi:hypothetical protein